MKTRGVLQRRLGLLGAALCIICNVGRTEEIVVRLERTVGGAWIAWIPHQPTGIWAIQASTTTKPEDWFYPPSQFDDGTRLQAVVPNVPTMYFRARLVRR